MRRTIIFLTLALIMSGCGFKSVFEPSPVKYKVIREADWKVEFRDIYFVDENNGWIIGDKGTIIHTSDGGKSWETQESGTKSDLNKIQLIGEKKAWIVGDRGTWLYTIDGRNWRKREIDKDRESWDNLTGLQFLDKYNGWVVGQGGLVYHTVNGGKTWGIRDNELGHLLKDVCFVNLHEGLITTQYGHMWRTADRGKSWEFIEADRIRMLLDIQFIGGKGVGWAVGMPALIMSTQDGGKKLENP